MPPFFYNKQVPEKTVPQHMKDYLRRTGRKSGYGKNSGGGAVGAKAVAVRSTVELVRGTRCEDPSCLSHDRPSADKDLHLVRSAGDVEAGRTGDTEKSKALLAVL